ncbi:MAG TPA: heme-binding protein [Stellaceae bacterium]|nr:heme-binding protein [Stellaceae bacterium]
MTKTVVGLLVGLSFAATTAAFAQAQQAPAPVPEQMPFDIPYGPSITLEKAKAVVAAAAAEAAKHKWKLNIAVVGPAGDLKYFERMDDAQLGSVEISQDKARASARFRRETKIFQDAVNGKTPAGPTPSILSLRGIVASEGGFPLVEGGKLIGAIGCSGATGAQDGVACKAGAETVK